MFQSPSPKHQKTIGVLGGCSHVSTAEYYTHLNDAANKRLGGFEIAETLIAGMNWGIVKAYLEASDWAGLASYMDVNVGRLKAGGAELLICGSNTLHHDLEEIAKRHELPFLHIADPTGRAIRAQGLRKVALLGTRHSMEGDHLSQHYSSLFGLEIVVPNEWERGEIDRIIFDELVNFDVRDASRDIYLAAVDRLVAEQGVEGVILGCTEIYTLIEQKHRPDLPMFDTTRLHCEAAVDMALGIEPTAIEVCLPAQSG
ncbi:amino acid racemase [Rhizobiaceae bacterium]|nr:amino acid racemase [Rhizobiaceae bacterium]